MTGAWRGVLPLRDRRGQLLGERRLLGSGAMASSMGMVARRV